MGYSIRVVTQLSNEQPFPAKTRLTSVANMHVVGKDFWRSFRYQLLPQTDVMSLLILLSIPAIAGIIGMAVAINYQVLYPRLKGHPPQMFQFRFRIHFPHDRKAA